MTALVQCNMKSSLRWSLPGLFCAGCCLQLNHHYQGFHVIEVPCEQNLAQIAFICHVFHVSIFHTYHVALKALRTGSYTACQARNISGRNPFSCKELGVVLLILGFFQPAAKCRSKRFVLLTLGSSPHAASQVVPFALPGVQITGNRLSSAPSRNCPTEWREGCSVQLWQLKKGSVTAWAGCWEAALQPGQPFCSVPLSSLYQVDWYHSRNQNAALPVSYTILIPDFPPLHASSISGERTTFWFFSHLTTASTRGCQNSILQIIYIPL